MNQRGNIPKQARPKPTTCITARTPDKATCFANLIEASGHEPRKKAGHMTAPFPGDEIGKMHLAPRAVPHMRVDRQSPALDQVAIPEERDWSVRHGGIGCCTGVAAEHISSHRTLLGLFTPKPGSTIGSNRPAFPAIAAKPSLTPRFSPAIPRPHQTMLDQCFSDIALVHRNARQ
jgi:hypothetical protein